MHADLEALLTLQEHDRAIMAIEAELAAFDPELEALDADLAQAQSELEAAQKSRRLAPREHAQKLDDRRRAADLARADVARRRQAHRAAGARRGIGKVADPEALPERGHGGIIASPSPVLLAQLSEMSPAPLRYAHALPAL